MIGTDTFFRAASTGARLAGGALSLSLRLARAPIELVGGLAEGVLGGEERPPDRASAREPRARRDSDAEARERHAEARDLDAEARERAATVVLERDEALAAGTPSVEGEAARGDLVEDLLSAAAGHEPPSPAEMRDAGREAIEEDAAVVGEFADAGAESGAGAEVRLAPPWDGYDNQTATEIRQSLSDATPAAAAAVQLYESTHRARASVLRAAERAVKGTRAGSNGH